MNIRIWAHTSIAWGISKSFERSFEIWWNALQIFAKSPRWWFFQSDKLSKEEINNSLEGWTKYNQIWWIIHSVYLINLAKDPKDSEKDIQSVIDDFEIAEKLWFAAVNVHLGKYWEYTKQQAIENMVNNLGVILERIKDSNVLFVFENTAGQGSEIGWNFEELWNFYDQLKEKFGKELVETKIKFCFDTAHAWWAWYDLNKWDEVLKLYDKYIWLNNLYCFHLNDSKAMLGSKLDRHANLGKGFIWLPALTKVIKWAAENDRPIVLETPDDKIWPQEIQMIKWILDWTFNEIMVTDFHKENFKTEVLKKFENVEEGLF